MSKQNKETRVVTAHLPRALAEKMDEISKAMERPRVWIIKRALTEWIEREEEKRRRTQDDAGE